MSVYAVTMEMATGLYVGTDINASSLSEAETEAIRLASCEGFRLVMVYPVA